MLSSSRENLVLFRQQWGERESRTPVLCLGDWDTAELSTSMFGLLAASSHWYLSISPRMYAAEESSEASRGNGT